MNLEPIWRTPTHQKLFRKLLMAIARPGEVIDITGFLAGRPAYLGVLATLVDATVTLSDPHGLLDEEVRCLLAAPHHPPDNALFVLANGSREPDFAPHLGDLFNPEKGATLIISGPSIGVGNESLFLQGPGIERRRELRFEGFHREWFRRRKRWVSNFPQGVDFILCDSFRIAAIPRTTVLEEI